MFYWLFTEGNAILAEWVGPLACLSVITPLAVAALLGVGIQRRVDGTPLKTSGLMSLARLLSFVIPSLGLFAIYTNLLSNIAIARPIEHQTPLKGFAAWLVGGPSNVNQYRLMILGFGLLCLLFFLNVSIWQGIRNGGWIRERMDRLR